MRADSFAVVLLLACIFILVNFSSAARLGGGSGPKTVGWNPIKNMSDPHVAEIGEFAVSEHNKETNSKLAFDKVIRGETQVVAGLNYKLVVEAKGGDQVGTYEAFVWEKDWEKFMKLIYFKPV